MTESILKILISINDDYANLILAGIAIISAFVAYREYILKRRPYVIPEITYEKSDGKISFYAELVNKGEYPGVAKITRALLKIGDEEYPTVFNAETVLSPTERRKIAPIGYINETGRRKIIGHEFRNNRVEIIINLSSRGLGQKKFRYYTKAEYEVDVVGEQPIFKLIKEEMR